MNYFSAVQKGIDFVEERLHSDFSLGEVSREANLSQWHFQRIFKALTNETLKTYIRSRRLAFAQKALLDGDERILEIALESGFESQQSFSRAFKKAFRLTPNQFRKSGHRGLFLQKARFDADYLSHINRNISLVPNIYQREPMQFIGKRTLFYGSDSEKNNMAQKLPKLWEEFLADFTRIEHRREHVGYGLFSIPAKCTATGLT